MLEALPVTVLESVPVAGRHGVETLAPDARRGPGRGRATVVGPPQRDRRVGHAVALAAEDDGPRDPAAVAVGLSGAAHDLHGLEYASAGPCPR